MDTRENQDALVKRSVNRRDFLKLSGAGLAGIALLGVAGCGGGGNSGGQAPTTVIKWGHFAPAIQPMEIAAKNMAERVAERTNGKIEIQTFPASQLGSIQQQLEQVQSGNLGMMFSNPSYISEIGGMGKFSIFDAPMIFEDEDHVREFGRSRYSQSLAKKLLTDSGLRILDPTPIFGQRHLSVNKEPGPIKAPPDLKGVSIRVHEAATRRDMISAWGANPVVTPTAEMYTAMQTGLADGQESPLSWQVDNKYWEVQEFVSLTGHFVQSEFIVISDELFQGLPKDVQKILKEEATKTADEMTSLYLKANDEAKGTLKQHGVTIVEDVDKEAFREATEPMWEKWESQWGTGQHYKVINREYEVMPVEEWQNY